MDMLAATLAAEAADYPAAVTLRTMLADGRRPDVSRLLASFLVTCVAGAADARTQALLFGVGEYIPGCPGQKISMRRSTT